MAKSVVGENALDRTIRLLGKFNERFADPEVCGMQNIDLVIHKDGTIDVQDAHGGTLFTGPAVQTVAFLAAPVAEQVLGLRYQHVSEEDE